MKIHKLTVFSTEEMNPEGHNHSNKFIMNFALLYVTTNNTLWYCVECVYWYFSSILIPQIEL